MTTHLLVIAYLTTFLLYGYSCYQMATLGLQATAQSRSTSGPAASWIWGGLVAHALVLYQLIDVSGGQNLTYLLMLSQICWFVSLGVTFWALFSPVESLACGSYLLSGCSVLLVILFPGEHVIPIGQSRAELMHVILSLLTMSVLLLTALQSLILIIKTRVLKRHTTAGYQIPLPSLMHIERLLVGLVMVSLVSLSILLLSSLTSLMFTEARYQLKLWLTFAIWAIFLILLIGRSQKGWRGNAFAWLSLTGVSISFIVMSI